MKSKLKILAVIAASMAAFLMPGTAQAYSVNGTDYAWARPSASQLRNAGVTFAARYLMPRSFHSGKALSSSEANSLHSLGIAVVLNYEYASGSAKGGYAAGVRDAIRAETARVEVGAPPLPIYFSVDYDERSATVVTNYLAGVSSVIGKSRTGVYGSYYTVRAAMNAGYPYAWQTYAWSGGKWDSRAQLRQTKNGALFGGDGDKDVAISPGYGGWAPGSGYVTPAPTPSVPRVVTPPAPRPQEAVTLYKVKRGDTLSAISQRCHTSVSVLVRLNHLSNPNRIYVGQVLKVTGAPTAAPKSVTVTYTVRRGDTLGAIAKRHGTTAQKLASLNHVHNVNRIYPGERLRLR
jgi:LysM repeat protein